MSEKFDVLVPIKEELLKGLIFGLKARLPIGVMLKLLGYCHEVAHLL